LSEIKLLVNFLSYHEIILEIFFSFEKRGFMGRIFTLDDLQKQFELAREKLSLLRSEIFSSSPLPSGFSREAYAFSYLRAERLGVGVIQNCLKGLSWLPMQLDPEAEIMLANNALLKRWIASSLSNQPDGFTFGNDFIHALTRVAINHGWESYEFRRMALCIGELFHDLSCLIGLIYYGVWMAENGISGVSLTYPYDLEHMAKEISNITVSPEVSKYLATRKKSLSGKKCGKKDHPALHVVQNSESGNAHPPASC
jgi:hypothetical protein